MAKKFTGIDIGAETVKIVELTASDDGALNWTRRAIENHHKDPKGVLKQMLKGWDWSGTEAAAVTGRLSRHMTLPRIPIKQAQVSGFKHLFGEDPATIVSIGSHGFSVLEVQSSNTETFRENSRCSQGTGNFLRQLVERFNLTIEEASEVCETIEDPAPLSGRCPVILKTDMTHLANKGEPQERILAGLYDAVCENVQVLIKPRVSPKRTVLIGGVTRAKRIRDNFDRFLSRHEMVRIETNDDDALFIEALGAAVLAAGSPTTLPDIDAIFAPPVKHSIDQVPALSTCLNNVHRIPAKPRLEVGKNTQLILGFDIGSTGSKVVAIDADKREEVWDAYISTNGSPVRASQALMQKFADSEIADTPVIAIGATGSGREIVGSLMSTCYGHESVFVLNEIAAHAEGALHYDKRVDTIFEIGGQDAKYIRLSGGRVIDAAMNEACSAGTGSFIEEQGRKFKGIDNVVQLADEAIKADYGVSLGQHCSVFMAEIIDEAVASDVPRLSIIAGIYDSIIQNYLNRVKGSRSVGQVIFCQGMPFSADALAAAVARQTGADVIIPSNPGTVGALGIALLSLKELDLTTKESLDVNRFLAAEVLKKDVFICKSTRGCGGSGNKCRIDRISTMVNGVKQKFTWGGGCSMYDKGTGRKKLPDLSPDPFREREDMVQDIFDRMSAGRGNRTIAITDEFVLKSLFPFFATFLYEMGLDPVFHSNANQATLKRGIEDANVPFCAPMQQYHGIVSQMAEGNPDFLFLPMMRGIPRIQGEPWARLCPIIQGSADMLKLDLGQIKAKIVSPVINIGKANLRSKLFLDSCSELARELGVKDVDWRHAYEKALATQEEFDAKCLELGRKALEFCDNNNITPVVVLGRAYTIYNKVLNSNVPAILREQGTIPIPVDCYPIDAETPVFPQIYWGYGHKNLRAAHQIRKTPGVYSLFASNYSCGPDSFVVHFYSYIMEGKPFAMIETDGHSGDAGTKTRIEAFLYCVHEDLEDLRLDLHKRREGKNFLDLQESTDSIADIEERDAIVLIPRMGPGAGPLAAALRGIGLKAESLPMPDQEALDLGRRYTSGKECFPMVITLGSMLQRIFKEKNPEQKFSFFMPTANGPCRFGAYNLLDRIVLERLGWKDRVSIWAPVDADYFDTVPDGFAALIYAVLTASDLLLAGLYHARPVEKNKGDADKIWEYYTKELDLQAEKAAKSNLKTGAVLTKIMSGYIFGIVDLLKRATNAFLQIMDDHEMPEVLIVGEIYVRCDPFSNNFVIDKLEQRGIRCRFAPFNEWLEYTDYQDTSKRTIPQYVTSYIQASIQHQLYEAMAPRFGWPKRTTVQDSLATARPYIREQLSGEAVLTLGGPVHEWREKLIDGTVAVGPLECMPNKIAQAQFYHVAEKEGLKSLTLSLNGDPVDPEILDNFAFEIHAQFDKRKKGQTIPPPPVSPRPPIWRPQSKFNVADE